MQDPIQISHDEVNVAAINFARYNHKGIVAVKHPVTGLPVNMALMPVSPYGSKAHAARKRAQKNLNKTLRTTAHEQWSIDRRATLTERGYAKLVGFALSHKYNKPATGKAQLV